MALVVSRYAALGSVGTRAKDKTAEGCRRPRCGHTDKSRRFRDVSPGSWSLFLLIIALLATLLTGCRLPLTETAQNPSCCSTNLAGTETSAPLSERSLYQLESIWTNDSGKPFRLAELRGRPQIMVMFFTSCQYACPILVHDLKRIEAALPEHVRSRTGFVLASFDTERDTPAALATYRERQQLPRDRWTLLHGRPDDVLELAALLGVQYKQGARGQFSHSNVITVLNAEGEIVHQQIGLNQDIQPTVSVAEHLTSQERSLPDR